MSKFDFNNCYNFGEILVDEPKLYYEDGKLIKKDNIIYPEDGIFRVYLPNKKLSIEMSYVNKQLNGITKLYFNNNGNISTINYYTNNKLDGICQNFREDGSLKSEESFINGVKEGIERYYYEDGKLKEEISYARNLRNGYARKYYYNGQIEQSTNFVNNKLEGIMRGYYETGEIEYEITYKNNVPVGWGTSYYKNGKVKIKTLYFKTKEIETHYFENGNVRFEIEVVNNVRNGKFTVYRENGLIKEIGQYVNDKQEGLFIGFYENKKIAFELNLKKGKRDGKYRLYYQNGNLMEEHTFKKDLRHGYSITYDKKGRIKSKIKYKEGIQCKLNDEYGILTTKDIVANLEEMQKNKVTTFILTDEDCSMALELKYCRKQKPAPFVSKKSKEDADKIIQNGKKNNTFIYTNYRLTKKLFDLEIKEMIPKTLYQEVAEIMAYCYEREKIKQSENFEQCFEQAKISKSSKFISELNLSKKGKNKKYRVDLVNCSRDLEFLTEKIVKNKKLNFSMCIYGDSGTGKSAYAIYLANELGLNVIHKSASDILDKYVGNSEKLVAEAFEEAKDKEAMLIIDEVDSFLRSRGFAERNWEVTLVNQMLTCMEDFEYPFICTTNYIDTLDQASLRRFTFKMKFGFLKPEKIETAFKYVFNMKPNTEILNMQGLTVSDFVSIKRECDILEVKDVNMIAKMLEETVSLKESEELRGHMGFNFN